MKLLADTIKSPKGLKGFTLIKEYMDDKYYIYRKIHTHDKYEAGYELFERKINTMFDCETIPGGNAFGVWAWQLPTKQKAYDKLNKIKNKNEQK